MVVLELYNAYVKQNLPSNYNSRICLYLFAITEDSQRLYSMAKLRPGFNADMFNHLMEEAKVDQMECWEKLARYFYTIFYGNVCIGLLFW